MNLLLIKKRATRSSKIARMIAITHPVIIEIRDEEEDLLGSVPKLKRYREMQIIMI